MAWWDELRRQMPVAQQWAYFDHAAVAPLSAPAARVISEWTSDIATNGDVHGGKWRTGVEQARQSAARLLGSNPDDIAFVANTSTGLSLIAESFPWQPGDNVVVPLSDFPSNVVPWRNLVTRGVEVRGVPSSLERLAADDLLAATDARTRLVAVSWVGFVTGWRQDLDELVEKCHQRGILLSVDAIQGLGVVPLDVSRTPIDFLAADGHKWLLGPEGAGLLYVRREHLDRLRPASVGWNSLRTAGNYDRSAFVSQDAEPSAHSARSLNSSPLANVEFRNSAARFEPGSLNVGGVLALGASIDLLLSFGIDAVWSRLCEVTAELRKILQSLGANVVSCADERRQSGIVAGDFPGRTTERFRPSALPHGVVINRRAGLVRLSPHAYTNHDDLDRLSRVLASI